MGRAQDSTLPFDYTFWHYAMPSLMQKYGQILTEILRSKVMNFFLTKTNDF